MVGPERSVCWMSRPSVRFWGFLVALVISVSLAVLFGVDLLHLVGIGPGLVAVAMGIVSPYVFRDGAP